MTELNEKQLVENRMICQLQGLGYEHVHSPALDEERETLRDVVLTKRLSNAIHRLNPWIDENNLNKMTRQVTHIDATSVMEANEQFHKDLVSYISIQQDLGKGKKNQTVKMIDFDDPENNEFLVVDQLTISDVGGTIKPDLILYINGLPLVVIECKSPTITNQMGEAVKQLNRYQREIDRLFHYTQFLIATSGEQAQAGTVGAQTRHYSEWKDPWPFKIDDIGTEPNRQDILTVGMLTKTQLLDLVQNFIVYEPEGGKTVKKLARYQQFRAVNKAVERILHTETPKERGGVVWHTQGSGKSLSMLYLAVKLRRISSLKNPTILIVTDRNDLDNQIAGTFRRCGFPNPKQAEGVNDLRQLLTQARGSTITTTVHKFQEGEQGEAHPLLSEDENIFVMVDESHRTQYKGLAVNMRSALPNACYLGFTGTPIDKEDRSTTRTFGPYIDKYTIQQAVDDGATVPIFYEGRMTNLHVQGESLDTLFDRTFREYPEEDRERIKQRFATEESLTGAPKRVEQIVLDLIHHFETHIRPDGFKAQLVAVNRKTAILYKEKLDELSDLESVVIFSGGHNDGEHLQKYHLSDVEEKNYIDRFKKAGDPLEIIIVVDKLLTGFDAPIEQVLYLDKPLKEHNLLQAIARTNRRYKGKTHGLLVDYYGVSSFLNEALSVFDDSDIEGALHPVESEIPRLQNRHRAAMRYFDHVDFFDSEACIQVLRPEDVRNEFDVAFRKFAESVNMVMPNPKAEPYKKDLKFLGKIRQMAKSRYREPQMDISDCGEKVKRLIADHLHASSIEVLHEPIDIMSGKFTERLETYTSDEAKASEMEHAIRHEIKVKLDENPVYYTSLKEKLEQLIEDGKEKRMDLIEQLEELQKITAELRNSDKQGEEEGFTKEEYPFFQLMEQELPYDDKEPLKELTHIITEEIQDYAVMDWPEKDEVQRQMRRKIKRQLRASHCPKDQLEGLTQQMMDLAKVHYKK
ncbi:type I restriction endonuclease subunit R [Salicibibacter halophilus]|uniref:Type I restriction enzyme endonuclease subunit n=1 Tax=Salicibibacter halophilus TaxID=2502791 RepID=A0A514LG11_9BACI|nr:type I restriction endonuclease subunit R [Salicibibacter halophilus]QDI90769.1 type I restriction endonuclease subunit R [Salicibibacter halophilus]